MKGHAEYISHADLGGRLGYGRVVNEPEGEYFHTRWEPRVLAVTLAAGAAGSWNLDSSRSARESLPNYESLSYYEIWFEALTRLLANSDLVQPDELAAGRALRPARKAKPKLMAYQVRAALAKGSPTLRESELPARYSVGDRVRLYIGEIPHHTRLPRYVRGKIGTIERVHGPHVFADARALGRGEDPQWLYGVAFKGQDLWPSTEDQKEAMHFTLSVDAWEPYLEPV